MEQERLLVKQAMSQKSALPSALYTSQETFERERREIFQDTWQYVGPASRLQKPGDFLTTRIGDVPIIVLRDDKGELSAFVNVCPHRGSELLLAPFGNRRTLQCHYHAWTFGLDGALKAAPCAKEQECFTSSEHRLTRLLVASLGPLLFVNANPNAPSLSSFLGALPQILSEDGVDLGVLELRERRTYETAANWKIIVENYLECYHCAVAHPRFSQAIDLNQYDVIPYESFSLQRGPIKSGAKELSATRGLQDSLYLYLWPNFMLNFYPGPGSLSLNLILPIDAHRSLAVYEFFFAKEVPEEEAKGLIDLIDEVQKEDVILCESVHRGMRSGFYKPGPLMLTREKGISHFHGLYAR